MRKGKFEHENLSEYTQPRLAGGDDWRTESACLDADPEIFFPDESLPIAEREAMAKEAKSFCASCRVQMVCLDFALRNEDESGIFGGLDDEERKPLVKGYAETEPLREVRLA